MQEARRGWIGPVSFVLSVLIVGIGHAVAGGGPVHPLGLGLVALVLGGIIASVLQVATGQDVASRAARIAAIRAGRTREGNR
ncbi:MAG: hypothetical protein HYY17_07690 [Planctomycetes bacterium]|nr:hypothetical protein [Planctomycetota bacterium]